MNEQAISKRPFKSSILSRGLLMNETVILLHCKHQC